MRSASHCLVILALAAAVSCSFSASPSDDGAAAPDNLYLSSLVEDQWKPGKVGAARFGYKNGAVADDDGNPAPNDGALGGPRGLGSYQSNGSYTCVGIDGSAVWRFEEGRYIRDGEGDDFVTFSSVFAWGRAADGLCCELAHVEVSPDGISWYRNAAERFTVNPDPGADVDGYEYAAVSGLHGNNPVWANVDQDVQAEELVLSGSSYRWVDIEGVTVSRFFAATDPYLGGTRFDLADFVGDDGSFWPADGKMRYLKIRDDSSILDGQDYSKAWCLGANLQSAMGINTGRDDE